MKALYDQTCRECASLITRRYSTSFSMGIRAFGRSLRPPIYAIYGYVRFADEIVDTFHDQDQAALLERFRTETWQAIDEGISLNPVLHAFQEVVNTYHMDRHLIDAFLDSMAMDLDQDRHGRKSFNEYIYGSAEVVGLMCLQVFAEGDRSKYEALKPFAMKLGSAFQKVNFLRDLKDDYQILGRTYFPNIDLCVFNNCSKCQIEKEIEAEFKEAFQGIKMLPPSSRFGVFLAYKYYLSLFKKIKSTSAERIIKERIRIPNSKKLTLMLSSYVQYKIAM